MVLNARRSLGLLFLLPIAAAVPNPTPAPDYNLGSLNLHYRGLLDPPDTVTTRSSSSSSSTTTSDPPDPITTTSTTSTTSTTTSTSTTSTSSSTTSAPASITSQSVRTDDNGQVVTSFIIVPAQSSTSSAAPSQTADAGGSGSSTGTFIGLGVAGGIALLGLAGFIIWKMTQKRFQQFDDDAGDINWPAPKEAVLQAPAAPSMMAATNATNSSIDLTKDPYAVPPLPPQRTLPYYDDPSGAPYYDPYRGPVPGTFTSPPASTEGGHHTYPGGEVIPMNTYPSSSGRQSPGPNAAYDDPYARSRSPGPMAAYAADPYARSQSPATMAYEDPYAGRRSPGPALAYGGGAVGAYDQMGPARMGTPVGGPGRVGTPVGYGQGGAVPPALDMLRTGTPQSGYRGPSPAPPGAVPYGRYTPNPYGQ